MKNTLLLFDDRAKPSRDAHIAMTMTDMQENPLADLTAKQREVLDLLIQHKTSKEISRILGISHHTVDQRIMLARAKLNVASRGEVAQAYRALVDTYERSVYEESHVAEPVVSAHFPSREVKVTAVRAMNMGGPLATAGQLPVVYHPVLPEAFDGPYGTLFRLGYIVAITVFLVVAVLGGLSMYSELARIVDY